MSAATATATLYVVKDDAAAAGDQDTPQAEQQSTSPKPRKRGGTKLDPVECAYADLGAFADIYFTEQGACFAEVALANGTKAQYPAGSRDMKNWLVYKTGETHHVNLRPQEAEAAIARAIGKAQHEGRQHAIYVRLAPHREPGAGAGAGVRAFSLDPGPREDGKVIVVTAEGWGYDEPPEQVKFWRPPGFLPLPDGLDTARLSGATLAELRPFLNLGPLGDAESDDRFRLIVGFLMGALMPDGDYPILSINGQKGSGKSSAMRDVRLLVDPNTATDAEPPGDHRSFMLHAEQHWTPSYDNLRHVEPWLSDALCRVATGAAAVNRAYYTDDTTKLFTAHRPVIVNGISDLARADDLLQRMLRVRLPGIDEGTWNTRRTREADYEQARPRLLAALLDAAVIALRERDAVEAAEPWKHRLADWYVWVMAAARSGRLGFTPEQFRDTAQRSVAASRKAALEYSPFAAALIGWLAERPGASHRWTGTADSLQVALAEWAKQHGTNIADKYAGWPSSPRALRSRLDQAEGDLAGEGVTITRHERSNQGRLLTLTYAPPKPGDAEPPLAAAPAPVPTPTVTLTLPPKASQVTLPTEARGDTPWARAFSLLPTCPNPFHDHSRGTSCPISKLPLPQPEKWARAAEKPMELLYHPDGTVAEVKPPLAALTGLLPAAGAYLLRDRRVDLPEGHKLRRVYETAVGRFEDEAKKLTCPHPQDQRKTIAPSGSARVRVRCQDCGADITDARRPQ